MNRRTGQYGTIEKRNGAWRGRYLIDVAGQAARVKRSVVLGFTKDTSKCEARRKLKAIIAAEGFDLPSYKIPSTRCFAEHVKQWELSHLIRMKPSTQSTMRWHLDTHLLPRWGKTAVDYITAERVNEWIGSGELAHLSRSTLHGIVKTLAMSLGVKFGKGNIHYPSQIKEEADPRCFTVEEVKSIVAEATGQYKVLFALASESGLRSGELFGLQIEDIDFLHSIVHVRRSAWNGKLQSPKGKNAKRAVDLQPYVMEMLKTHLAGRVSGPVFISRRKTLLCTATVLHKHLHPILKKLNLKSGGMHGFRHFRVSFLVENGTSFEIIKKWIGHGSDSMIRRYMHLSKTFFKSQMAMLPNVIDPLDPQMAAA
jgi:integrase